MQIIHVQGWLISEGEFMNKLYRVHKYGSLTSVISLLRLALSLYHFLWARLDRGLFHVIWDRFTFHLQHHGGIKVVTQCFHSVILASRHYLNANNSIKIRCCLVSVTPLYYPLPIITHITDGKYVYMENKIMHAYVLKVS